MKRFLVGSLALSLLVPFPAIAANTVPYKNQKSGQFCKTVDIGKSVKLPDGMKLKCTKDGARARWKMNY
ncbi:MAG: hypothetical protein EBV63_02135 [Actinobacteria bacterium]|jgi:hypothetical protein|nr:hypothetical protein [Actinomycetota bacterium]NCV08386.1 hypothetical protein [Actinomycetota bacterium]NCW43711.1 hypothetical protein [Actinomycetota bacterium]NCW92950.1 hypothetical protein [Actinomycetota bacterium]NCX16830.1 hypothetical protein [Actinomycetota bacterium]